MKVQDVCAFVKYPYDRVGQKIRAGYLIPVGSTAIEIDSIADIDYIESRLSEMRKEWIEEISSDGREGQM